LPKITPNAEQSYIQKMSNKAIKPTDNEIATNPRSRSAKLRSIIKMGNDKININRKDLKMERLFELEEKYAG
jgi:Predicted S-adenosylmethionine-dependent methyltransferase involved in cell envelope biogenesis